MSKLSDLKSIKDKLKINEVVNDIKEKIHQEEPYHAKTIPNHRIPFDDQIVEAQDILLNLSIEVKTRHRALRKLSTRLENARLGTKNSGNRQSGKPAANKTASTGPGELRADNKETPGG